MSIDKKNTTYDVGNPCPGLGQTHRYGVDKPVNDLTLPLKKTTYYHKNE